MKEIELSSSGVRRDLNWVDVRRSRFRFLPGTPGRLLDRRIETHWPSGSLAADWVDGVNFLIDESVFRWRLNAHRKTPVEEGSAEWSVFQLPLVFNADQGPHFFCFGRRAGRCTRSFIATG